jgi:hypothetical protein
MRYLALVLAVVGAATAAGAQDAIPDIKGTWTGKGKVAVFGSNVHIPAHTRRPMRRACATST